MENQMKFSECMSRLLSILNISGVRLARVLNVDSSLVNRWINDRRVPPYNSDYIERISEYLSLNIQSTFQDQRLSELFLEVFSDNASEQSKKELIKKALLHSQGVSLENKKLKQSKSTHIGDVWTEALEGSDELTKIENEVNQDTHILQSLSSKDKVIFGRDAIIATSVSLLEKALNSKNNKTIYISFNNGNLITVSILQTFKKLLLATLRNGYHIIFLVRIDNDMSKLNQLIDFVQEFIYTGNFQLYYLKKYDQISTYEDYIIVQDVGALIGLTYRPDYPIHSAFYFQNSHAVNVVKNMFHSLVLNHAKPLIHFFWPEQVYEYVTILIENEEQIGNRILYQQDFSILAYPESLYEKLLRKEQLSDNEIQRLLTYYRRIKKAFLSNVCQYTHTDIYHKDCIKNLIKRKTVHLNMYHMTREVTLEREDLKLLLTHIITMLKKYKNYNIVFTAHDFSLPDYKINCMIKGRDYVLIESHQKSKKNTEVRLAINEPLVVKAFDSHFTELIDQITPIYKEKNEVIGWIQSLSSLELL